MINILGFYVKGFSGSIVSSVCGPIYHMLEILLQHDCTQHIVLKDIYMCFTVDELVLMDEFDGKIQTTVRKTLVYKFLPMLEEGVVYKMSYFTVIPNIPSYRATAHDYRLIFLYKTTMCQSSPILGEGCDSKCYACFKTHVQPRDC